jgi:hypothetical protein
MTGSMKTILCCVLLLMLTGSAIADMGAVIAGSISLSEPGG